MRKKKPHVAVMDEVRIVRRGQYAEIGYCDPTVAGVCLKVGPEVQNMTDQEIVNRLNDVIRAQQKWPHNMNMLRWKIPQGHPQIRYSEECDKWVSRGGVAQM